MAPCYPDKTQDVVTDISQILDKHYAVMKSNLRHTLVKALILLRNRNEVTISNLSSLVFNYPSTGLFKPLCAWKRLP